MHACTRLTCISTTTNVMSSVKYAPPSKPVKRHRLKIKVALGVTRWMRSVLSGDHFCRGTHQVSGAFQPPRVQFLPPACQPCQRRLCGLYSDAAAALVLQKKGSESRRGIVYGHVCLFNAGTHVVGKGSRLGLAYLLAERLCAYQRPESSSSVL